MKDDRLEKEFEEYFKGVNISNDIIADAKQSVKPKRRILPKIMKFASVAASIVLVFAVAITVMTRVDLSAMFPDSGMTNSGNSSGSLPPNHDGDSDTKPDIPDESSRFELYTDSDLVQSYQNAYTVSSLNSSLKFIENLAYSYNSTVEACNAGYKDGKLALVTAEISILRGLNRDETTVYVEFTDKLQIYKELEDYYDGRVQTYRGIKYFLTSTRAENGEPEFKLHISYHGIKYYFSVHSSDISVCQKYLELVIN